MLCIERDSIDLSEPVDTYVSVMSHFGHKTTNEMTDFHDVSHYFPNLYRDDSLAVVRLQPVLELAFNC